MNEKELKSYRVGYSEGYHQAETDYFKQLETVVASKLFYLKYSRINGNALSVLCVGCAKIKSPPLSLFVALE